MTALEANATVRAMAASQILKNAAELGRSASDWTLVGDLSVNFNGGPFDVIVSELLGSMINSESQCVGGLFPSL